MLFKQFVLFTPNRCNFTINASSIVRYHCFLVSLHLFVFSLLIEYRNTSLSKHEHIVKQHYLDLNRFPSNVRNFKFQVNQKNIYSNS